MRIAATASGVGRDRASGVQRRAVPGLAARVVVVAAVGLATTPAALGQGQLSEPFGDIIELGSITGHAGMAVSGAAEGDVAGGAVALCDLNGDGLADLAVGAPGASSGGEVYVVFGRGPGAGGSLPADVRPGDLDGTLGFRVIEPDRSAGAEVTAAGDFNGDGVDDLAISDPSAAGAAGSRSGVTWVVFGRTDGFAPTIRLAELDGTDGVALRGIGSSGTSIALAGDVNDDGLDDLVIGARRGIGEAYVVYGTRDGFPASIDLTALDGGNGFRLIGAAGEEAGWAVAGVGDANADGVDDVLVGAPEADVRAPGGQGRTYLIYGRAGGFPAEVPLAALGPAEGARFEGVDRFEASGAAVSGAGDLNADGIADFAIGAGAWGTSTSTGDGACYVVYGVAGGYAPVFDLATLDGVNGFRLIGPRSGANVGAALAAAGDANSDGVDDLLVGAGGSYDGDRRVGFAYLVEGRAGGGFGASTGIETLVGAGVTRFQGEMTQDRAGTAVAGAGDVNADGVVDLVIGASRAAVGGILDAGRAYVVYGRDPDRCAADLDGDGAASVSDFLAFQNLFDAGDAAADFDADGSLTIFDFLAFQNAFDAGCP